MSDALTKADASRTDDDLVVRARTDRSAFAALYDRYYPRIMRYCLRRLFVRDVAEDVVSDVFLQIARYLPGFEGATETDFRRWLFRIASNAVNGHLRQARRRQELWEEAGRSRCLAGSERVRATLPMFEALDWPAVYQAIVEMEPRDQTILTLRFFADLPHDEIAHVVGANAGAIRTALSRILERLRARFGVEQQNKALPEGRRP
jgi:RNA polymerase sigma-70 factor, ECF subfamily